MTEKTQHPLKQTNLNHFVARFTSRPWLLGSTQFYKLSTGKTAVQATPAGPRNWGGEENLYSKDVEDAFEKIEDKLARLQRKLEGGSSPTDDERYGWAMWLLASYLRTPAAFLCSAEVSASMCGFTGNLGVFTRRSSSRRWNTLARRACGGSIRGAGVDSLFVCFGCHRGASTPAKRG
jgi:hypothetical protein